MKLIIFILFSFPIIAQNIDEKTKFYSKINWHEFNSQGSKKQLWQKSIVPLTLAGISLSLNTIETKTKIQNSILKPFNGYETTLDDYLQYAPIATMYTADLLKIKAKNSVWNQTKYLAMSEFFTSGIVQILKYSLKIQRPNNGAFNSFPSGHTSQAFVTSQVLFNEFYQTNKVIAFSGILMSTTTGSLRVINNRHWVPDVLMGAGIGILVTNLIYHFEPLKNWNPWRKELNSMSFVPSLGFDYTGFTLKKSF